MLNEILVPYIAGKRKELILPSKPWLLKCFQWSVTDAVKDVIKKSNGKMVPAHNNWPNYFQPLHMTINKFFASRSPKLVLTRNSEADGNGKIVGRN